MSFQFSQQLGEDNEFETCLTLRDYGAELGVDVSVAMYLSEDMEQEQLQSIQQQLEDAIDKANKDDLIQMGRCCMGFKWRREGNGYRCEGGSHYVSDTELRNFRSDK